MCLVCYFRSEMVWRNTLERLSMQSRQIIKLLAKAATACAAVPQIWDVMVGFKHVLDPRAQP